MTVKQKIKNNRSKQKKTPRAKKSTSSAQKKKIAELTLELELLKNKNVRLLAEFNNYKRRTADEKNNLIKYSGEKLVLDILSPLDDLKRTIESKSNSDYKTLLDGISLVYKKFQDNLNGNSISFFNSVSKVFNPELHEAVMSEVGKKDNIIIREFEPGYKYHDKVIRHAKVVVSKKKS